MLTVALDLGCGYLYGGKKSYGFSKRHIMVFNLSVMFYALMWGVGDLVVPYVITYNCWFV